MKKLISAVLLALPAFAQWADTSGNIGASNLYNPLNGKPSYQVVAGAPTSLACTAGKDLAYNSVARTWHICTISGSPGTWAQLVALDASGNVSITGTLSAAGFINTDTTHNGANYLQGVTSGGLTWTVADVAGTATTLLYPTDSATATTGNVLAIGSTVTCPTLPAGVPTTCRSTSWAAPATATSYNQTVQVNSTPQTQRAKLNFAAGSNVTLTASDNGSDTTTVTVAATGGSSNLLYNADQTAVTTATGSAQSVYTTNVTIAAGKCVNIKAAIRTITWGTGITYNLTFGSSSFQIWPGDNADHTWNLILDLCDNGSNSQTLRVIRQCYASGTSGTCGDALSDTWRKAWTETTGATLALALKATGENGVSQWQGEWFKVVAEN